MIECLTQHCKDIVLLLNQKVPIRRHLIATFSHHLPWFLLLKCSNSCGSWACMLRERIMHVGEIRSSAGGVLSFAPSICYLPMTDFLKSLPPAQQDGIRYLYAHIHSSTLLKTSIIFWDLKIIDLTQYSSGFMLISLLPLTSLTWWRQKEPSHVGRCCPLSEPQQQD